MIVSNISLYKSNFPPLGPSRRVVRSNMPDRAANPSGSVQMEDMIDDQERQCLTGTHTATINAAPKCSNGSTTNNISGGFHSNTLDNPKKNSLTNTIKNSPRKGSRMSLNHNYDDMEDLNKKNTPSRHSYTLSRHSLAKTDEELEKLEEWGGIWGPYIFHHNFI